MVIAARTTQMNVASNLSAVRGTVAHTVEAAGGFAELLFVMFTCI